MAERRMTMDEAALRLILAGDDAGLEGLHRQLMVADGRVCPECGGRDIQDNGAARRADRSYLCPCGHLWDAEAV